MIDTAAGEQKISLSAHITDDLSGVAGLRFRGSPTEIRFVSPSGQETGALFQSGVNLAWGNANDGLYESEIILRRYSDEGVWMVAYFSLVDDVGNVRRLSAADLRSRGFPASFRNGRAT